MILTMSGTVQSMVLTKGPINVSGPKNVIKKHMKIPTMQILFTHTHTLKAQLKHKCLSQFQRIKRHISDSQPVDQASGTLDSALRPRPYKRCLVKVCQFVQIFINFPMHNTSTQLSINILIFVEFLKEPQFFLSTFLLFRVEKIFHEWNGLPYR